MAITALTKGITQQATPAFHPSTPASKPTTLAVVRDTFAHPSSTRPNISGTVPVAPLQQSTSTGSQSVVNIANQELQKWQNGEVTRSSYYPAGGYGSADHAWCADFVSTVFKEAGYPLGDLQYPSLSGSASAPRLAEWFAAGSATSNPYRIAIPANDPNNPPKPGDVVFFGSDPSNPSSITHTGIVTNVYPDGSFDTIEGNVNGTNEYDGEVAQRHYTAEDRDQVYGFGRRCPPAPRPQQHRFIPV